MMQRVIHSLHSRAMQRCLARFKLERELSIGPALLLSAPCALLVIALAVHTLLG